MVLDLVKEEYDDCLSELGLSHLDRIVAYNSRMDNLVRSLLTYARITTKVQPFTLINFNEIVGRPY